MYTLKGFVTIDSLIDNTVGNVSPVGELSQKSLTFSKEKGYYSNGTSSLTLVSFYSHDGTNNVSVPSGISSRALEMVEWIHTQADAGVFDNVLQDFIDAFLAAYGTGGSVADYVDAFEAGEMVEYAPGKFYPSYIRYDDVVTTGDVENIRLWLSDADFQTEYDEYELVIVPPAEPIDLFQGDYVSVQTAVNAITPVDRSQAIQTAQGVYPDTLTRTVEYEWVDVNNVANVIPTYWTIIIYGPAGNNQDIIKQAIVDWILATSVGYPNSADWEDTFPDLFKSTEFIIAPFWNDYSIPNQTVTAGVYSPTIEVGDILPYMRWACSQWAVGHVDIASTIMGSAYKSLALGAAGGPDNRDGIIKFRNRFPQYTALPTDDVDFERMSPYTQDFITTKLIPMIVAAESMTATSDVPVGMDRLERDGKYYCASSYDNVLYLILTKESAETYPG